MQPPVSSTPESGWSTIKDRPLGGKVEFNSGTNKYRKSGRNIQSEAARQLELETHEFPVPHIVLSNDEHYIEKSLAGKPLIEAGPDPKANFDSYKDVLSKFLEAQLSTPREVNEESLREGIRLENVLGENPELFDDTRLASVFERLIGSATFLPWSISHGDFSPTNVFSDGVIDWEFGFEGPVGYDVLALPLSSHLYGPGQRTVIDRQRVADLTQQIGIAHGVKNLKSFEPHALFMKSVFYLSFMRNAALEEPHKRDLWFRRKNMTRYLSEHIIHGTDPQESELAEMSGNYLEGAVMRARNSLGEVLLVTYDDEGTRWHMPGGAVEPGDHSPTDTALREVIEEVGTGFSSPLSLSRSPDVLAFLLETPYDTDEETYVGKFKTVCDATYATGTTPELNTTEVKQAEWFGPDRIASLPMFEGERNLALA